jgi:hypothetical protein
VLCSPCSLGIFERPRASFAYRYICYILQAVFEGASGRRRPIVSRVPGVGRGLCQCKARADLPMGILNMLYLLNTVTECIDPSAERVSATCCAQLDFRAMRREGHA